MRSALCLLALLALMLVPLGGCSRDKPAPSGSGGATTSASGGSGTASAAGASAAGPTAGSAGAQGAPSAPGGVAIFVNDAQVATVTAEKIANWPRLDTLVPEEARRLGTWEMVALQGAAAKPAELPHPSTGYPDMVPAVFPGASGGVSFGMFDPVELAKRGKPALREDHVQAIRIKVAMGGGRGQNDDGGGGGGDPTKLVLTFRMATGATTLSGDKLLALPREPMPGNPDQKGWRLTVLLDAAGVKDYQRLVLTDVSGANLILERKAITDASVPFVRLNKQGALRFRVMTKTGDGWTPSGDLRGLTTIDVK
jgi:hypothetical protein